MTTVDPQTPPTGAAEAKTHKPLREQALGGYWRVPALLAAGAVAAFVVSFIFPSQYSAVTRLIIHPNESSYTTTDSGTQVEGTVNIGGIDITKQATLGNTLVNLATSEEAAAEIVDRIGVETLNDGEEPELGTMSKVVNVLKVGGAGSAPTAERAAIGRVQGAVEAVVLDESWVMEITAWDVDPQMAAQIADTAADVAVDQSARRFRENSLRELDFLTVQLEAARGDVATKAQAVADFKSANGLITDASANPLGAAFGSSAPANLEQLNTDLVGLRAREQVLREQLAATAPTTAEFAAREQALQSIQGEITVAEAQFNDLAARLGGGSAPEVNEFQVELTALQQGLEQSQVAYERVNLRHTAVAATVDKPRYDASRLGEVIESPSPGRPLRFLFLLVGALVGALAGLLLTWFRSIREDEEARHDGERGDAGAFQPEDAVESTPEVIDVREPARAGPNGSGAHQPSPDRPSVGSPRTTSAHVVAPTEVAVVNPEVAESQAPPVQFPWTELPDTAPDDAPVQNVLSSREAHGLADLLMKPGDSSGFSR